MAPLRNVAIMSSDADVRMSLASQISRKQSEIYSTYETTLLFEKCQPEDILGRERWCSFDAVVVDYRIFGEDGFLLMTPDAKALVVKSGADVIHTMFT